MTERASAWLLVILLVGQLALLAVQVPGRGGTGNALESAALLVVGPAARLVTGTASTVTGTGRRVRLQADLLAENQVLNQEVERLRLELLRLRDVESEMQRLAAALDYTAPPVGRVRAADVVYVDHTSWLRTLVVWVGEGAARPDQPVLAPEGLVGRVVLAAGPYAKVQLVTDRAAAVGAMIARTRRQGVVHGAGTGALVLDYVPLQTDVRPGDRVLTAGIDGVYPRGIPVGTVTAVEEGSQLFHLIHVAPAVDLGSLDRVYLLEHQPLPPTVREPQPGASR
ncbi:MAG TPA: rod shape-determining protein MreC [Thermoanaerobaculia bacterium]|nr:rod shape-determining protein MreC [Thermoanaerobaculia bacterium]